MSVALRQRTDQVLAKLRDEQFLAQVRIALPGNITPERFVRVTTTAILQNPDIVKADRGSLFHSIIRCAQDGLLPDGREAALVTFAGKAQYLPMVGGLRKVAAKSGVALSAYVVYENDEFTYELGTDPAVTHRPPALDVDRGVPVGAYAVATDREGRKYLEVMSRGEIEQVRAASRAAKSGPWVQWWGEMARKTVARRLFKQLPVDDMDESSARIIAQSDREFPFRNPDWSLEEADAADALGAGFVPPEPEPVLDGEYETPVGVQEAMAAELEEMTEQAEQSFFQAPADRAK